MFAIFCDLIPPFQVNMMLTCKNYIIVEEWFYRYGGINPQIQIYLIIICKKKSVLFFILIQQKHLQKHAVLGESPKYFSSTTDKFPNNPRNTKFISLQILLKISSIRGTQWIYINWCLHLGIMYYQNF